MRPQSRLEGPEVVVFTRSASDRPLYRRDILNSISYPEGWTLTLTYRERWVDKDLWELVNKVRFWPWQAKGLAGKRALLVMCSKPDESTDTYTAWIPTRFATIIAAEVSGPADSQVVSVRVKLGGWPSKQVIENFTTLVDCERPLPSRSANVVSRYLVGVKRRVNANEKMEEADVGYHWKDHVTQIRTTEASLTDATFVRMEPVASAKRPILARARAALEPASRTALTTMRFRAGRAYRMSVQIHPDSVTDWTEVPVKVRVEGKHLEVSTALVMQHTDHAVVSYFLAAERKYTQETVALSVCVLGKDGKPQPVGRAPEFQVLVQICPPRLFLLWTIGLVTFGAAGLSATSEMLAGIGADGSDLNVLIAKMFGGLLVATAGFYALRKLPVNKI